MRLERGREAQVTAYLFPRLAFHHDVEIDELLGERAHVILEAEGVFA